MDINAETKRILEFVTRGNYHAAINIALSAMNECRRNNDQAGVDEFISLIKDIVLTLSEEYGSRG